MHSDLKSASAPQRLVKHANSALTRLATLFMGLCNICLLLMLVLTAATFLLRPLDISAYWIWPWTLVLFVWLSFFGLFPLYAHMRDVRVDFLIERLPGIARPLTRLLTNLVALLVMAVLIVHLPRLIEISGGIIEGVALPGGHDLQRRALFIPLFISSVLTALCPLVDLAAMALGLPEKENDIHPEASA